MDYDEIKEGTIVYLRHGFFPDSDTIDYRLNGRPYLVYSIEGDDVLLLKLSTSNYFGEPFYYLLDRVDGRGNEVTSYLDLRYLLVISKERLISEMNMVLDSKFKKRFPKRLQKISEEAFEKIVALRKNMEIVNEFNKLYPLYK